MIAAEVDCLGTGRHHSSNLLHEPCTPQLRQPKLDGHGFSDVDVGEMAKEMFAFVTMKYID